MKRKNAIRKYRLKSIDRIVSKYLDNDPDGKGGMLDDMRQIKRLCDI